MTLGFAQAQEDAEEPGTAYLAGQGPPIDDEDDPDEYEGEDQPESEDFEEGDDDGAEGDTPAGAPLPCLSSEELWGSLHVGQQQISLQS